LGWLGDLAGEGAGHPELTEKMLVQINNASAIWLKPTDETPMKRFDLMFGINVRGTFLCTRACLPHLRQSASKGRNPHVLNLSPPLNMSAHWFENHTAYTMAKYGMSMCVLGQSEEFKKYGIAVNALWPRTGIATAAIGFIGEQGGVQDETFNQCRTVDIMSDAAHVILSRPAQKVTGQFFIDDEVLLATGKTKADLEKYACKPGHPLMPDFFLDEVEPREETIRALKAKL
jgi:citronellol/citronellal dehydrogenase